jgi:lipopolysaccharide/colanic/teichoic acid biosynthesis glycosyltransferase
VGPRPEVRKWVAVYPERWRTVHQVRPGITDPASIEFRHEEELLAAAEDAETTYREQVLPRKLTLYEDYVQHASLRRDLAILGRTLMAVVLPRR